MLLSHESRIRREVLIWCKYGIRYDGSGCGGGGGSGGGGNSKRCARYEIPHADLVYHVRTMETMRATRLSCAVVKSLWDLGSQRPNDQCTPGGGGDGGVRHYSRQRRSDNEERCDCRNRNCHIGSHCGKCCTWEELILLANAAFV